jgi:ABC-type lipoprotein release transport system permease subunit
MRRKMVPLSYPLRSLAVRWQASILSALGIAMTIAVLCGVFALRGGFQTLMSATGADDVAVFLRPGATSEGESGITLEDVQQYKVLPEVALDPESGQPLAAGECYLALFLEKRDDAALVNVPIRGVEPSSFAIHGGSFRLVKGRMPTFGADEIIVGASLPDRIKDCRIGERLEVNVTPFEVVGVFEHEGAYRSELWGDVDRITAALERPFRQRILAKVRDDVDLAAFAQRMEDDKRLPSKVMSERGYFATQTNLLGDVLQVLGTLLGSILGIAAVLGAANTMLAAIGARTREIGVLRSLGFGRRAILLSFLMESALIGLVGGVFGCLIVLPLDGLQTGTVNWNTFTEQAFAFRVDGPLLLTAVIIAVLLGLAGGFVPSWRASRMRPVEAMRRL